MYSTDAKKRGSFATPLVCTQKKPVAIPTPMTYVRRNKDICIVPYESVSSYIGLFTTKKGSFVVPLVCTSNKTVAIPQGLLDLVVLAYQQQ